LYNARYYNPVLGRFISADTIVPDPANPQDLNRYSYVNNNPTNYTDPTGHCIWDVCVLEAAAYVALAVGVYVWSSMQMEHDRQAAMARIGSNESQSSNAPASSDTGGNTADPGGLDPNDNNDLNNLVANKGNVEVRQGTNSATGQGKAFEDFLQKHLGGRGSFEARRANTGGYQEFDGAYNNGRIWYEAKAWDWSRADLYRFFSITGDKIKIAEAAGREFQLISRSTIPDAVKQWLLKHGATFLEVPIT
jgi:hypothetical protein